MGYKRYTLENRRYRLPVFIAIYEMNFEITIMDQLTEIFNHIDSRKTADPKKSYTAKLHKKGENKICQKVGEEAAEVIIAALKESPEDLLDETADLLYHLMVLLSHKELHWQQAIDALAKRQGISGIDEKNSRSTSE